MIGSADERDKTSGQAVSLDLGELSTEDADVLREWLVGDHPKSVHDSKPVIHVLWNYGFELVGAIHDTFLVMYLLRPSQCSYSLDNVAQRHLGQTLSQTNGQMTLLDDPVEDASHVVAVVDLAERSTIELDEVGPYSVCAGLEVPLTPVFSRVERAGIAMDADTLGEPRKQTQTIIDDMENVACNFADKSELNLRSPKQLQEMLFDQLGISKTKKVKTGYSTTVKEIEGLTGVNPHSFLDCLLRFRESQKMKSIVKEPIKAVVDDGRIHTTFNQTVTAAGCLSPTGSSLQDTPVCTEFGRRICEAFAVGEGYTQLITANYSQIEMRVMAHLLQGPGLIKIYQQGEDLYNYVSSKIFGVGIDEAMPELRRRVEATSYGLAYGPNAFGLVQQLDIPQCEAKKLMEGYFERFGGVRDYLHRVVEQVRKDDFTATMFDRHRYLPELNVDNRIARDNTERTVLNSSV